MSSLSFSARCLLNDLYLLSLLLLISVTKTFGEELPRRSSSVLRDLGSAPVLGAEPLSESFKEAMSRRTESSLADFGVSFHEMEEEMKKREEEEGKARKEDGKVGSDEHKIQNEDDEDVNKYFGSVKSQVREKTSRPFPVLRTRLGKLRSRRMRRAYLIRRHHRLRSVAPSSETKVRNVAKPDKDDGNINIKPPPLAPSFGDPRLRDRDPALSNPQDPQRRMEDMRTETTGHLPHNPSSITQTSSRDYPPPTEEPQPSNGYQIPSKRARPYEYTSSYEASSSRWRGQKKKRAEVTLSDMLALLSHASDLQIAVPESISPEAELRLVSYLASFIPESPQNIYRFWTDHSTEYSVLYVSPKLISRFNFA